MPRSELRPDDVEHFRRRRTAAAAKLFAAGNGYEGVTQCARSPRPATSAD